MFPTLSPAPRSDFRIRVRLPKLSFTAPVTDPYDRCFFAVCAALKGNPALFAAMEAIVSAKEASQEARHA